jgi:hypothetical protein
MTGGGAPTRLRERRLLLCLSVGLPLAEMAVLGLLGIPSGRGLAAQVTALGPFGVFHDLRWLFVFHRSVLGFAVGLAVLLALRSLLMALLVRSAWPGRPPRFGLLVGHGLVSTAVVCLFLSPWVTLLFGAAVVPFSWVYFAAVPPAIATIVVFCHGGIDTGWWRRLPPLRAASWAGLSFLALSLCALGVAGQSGVVAYAVVAATGFFNAWAWEHAVGAIVVGLPARSRRPAPVTVLVGVLVLVVVAGGSSLGFAATGGEDPGVWVAGDVEAGVKAVLLVGGFASGCCEEGPELQGDAPGLYVEQFSYLGRTSTGDPLPHSGNATDVSLARAAGLMSAQVSDLARRSGARVSIVAESEGTLVVAAYLATYPEAPVDRVMLLSPILDPVRVTYPDPGGQGLGVVAGYELRAVGELIDAMAPFKLSADGPLVDSMRSDAAQLHRAATCDHPQVDEVAIVPLADSVIAPVGGDLPIDVIVVPGFHGGLRGRADVQQMIRSWVSGGDLVGSEVWKVVDWVIAGSASAWQVPSLDSAAPWEDDCGG